MAILVKKDNNARWDNNENSSNTKLTLSDGNIRFYHSPPPNSKLMFKKDRLGWGNNPIIPIDSIMFSYNYKRFESGPHPGSFDLIMTYINDHGYPVVEYNPINLKVTGPYNSIIKKYSEIGRTLRSGNISFQRFGIAANDPNHVQPITIVGNTIRNNARITKVDIGFDSGITFIEGYAMLADNTLVQLHKV